MARDRERRIVFLSHARADAPAANILKTWLSSSFGNELQVFASSDSQSIEMGVDWYEAVDRALRDSTLGILLITENSLTRTWIGYELGALRANRKKTIPVCLGSVTKSKLPSPFSHAQACDYNNPEDRLDLLRSIASTFGFPINWIPEEAAYAAPSLLYEQVAEPAHSVAGHGPAIENLFRSSDRWATVVYTCRATFTGEHCVTDRPIKKSLWAHIPVDEVQTLCTALNHFLPSESRTSEDDILQTVVCSKHAEEVLVSQLGNIALAGNFPAIFNRDLIIIGENNFSNLLLQIAQAYLPWQAGWEQTARRMEKPRPNVYVELVPRFNSPVSPGQKRELHRGGGMIAIFPNPFNIRKRVLFLYGCHRQGQFTLEDWLRRTEVRQIIEELEQKTDDKGMTAIQIALDRTLMSTDSDVQPAAAEAIRNITDGKQYWLTILNREDINAPLTANRSCSDPYDIYDLSLLATLPSKDQDKIGTLVDSRIGLEDTYREDRNCEVGFHITLYEFLTHRRPDKTLLKQLETLSQRIAEELSGNAYLERPISIFARLRGFELFPTAIVSYVDFMDETGHYTSWLDSVRKWCERSVSRVSIAPRNSLLNSMRSPFPAHVTLCRFNREIKDTEKAHLQRLTEQSRGEELLRFALSFVSLAVAKRAPYQLVNVARNVSLQDANLSMTAKV